ncbi:N-acylneuraminate cytidylyltransferase [Eubacterium oxidoreducens]|uniref:N-acylneuraminate cytidylyltransferase n=1 Tax=Eubacterium oxidoreducens TaxID=1732 RepID=A0A1G6BS18_EUBOX|nr:N-acylneuraminate cytidylyltransferase [Eubacterium oxidoreducens]SDB23430.1 N-acylneuraminate cytidylyltransferase [Eubacterium oxidoreducens]
MTVAFIPVRGGSKSIPLKNIKPILGKPLVYWTVKAACECSAIDKVYIATDSDKIKETVEHFHFPKAVVIGRSAESASDTASTESAMLEFASQYDFDNIVLIQATSPLLTADDLTRGMKLFESDGCDSVLSAVLQKRFYWEADSKGFASPMNYDVYHRPRRQDFDGSYTENGAFYITRKEDLLRTKNRVSGRMKICEMSEESFFEIDEPSDWVIIEALMRKKGITAAPCDLSKIKLFLTDCDGCLTDGGMYLTENGDELKRFQALDGKGIAILREHGVKVGIVTGETRNLLKTRAQKLKLHYLKMGADDKLPIVKQICDELGISLSEVAYVGDDLPDIPVIQAVGYGCSVPNGREEVKAVADYVTTAAGGNGAIREVTDQIAKAKGIL